MSLYSRKTRLRCPKALTKVLYQLLPVRFCVLDQSGRRIIGMDLSEIGVGENDWDANVGARVLFRLCNILVASNPQ